MSEARAYDSTPIIIGPEDSHKVHPKIYIEQRELQREAQKIIEASAERKG